nr:MAG TPA: hypothetical protein [Caudoviricetes sp.]
MEPRIGSLGARRLTFMFERIFYAHCHVFMSEACGQLRLAVS